MLLKNKDAEMKNLSDHIFFKWRKVTLSKTNNVPGICLQCMHTAKTDYHQDSSDHPEKDKIDLMMGCLAEKAVHMTGTHKERC